MLHELVVDNLGVIERAEVLLQPGLTALTGETGAGKTLVTEAINLLSGGRADPMLVRPGATEAVVQGRFVAADATEHVVRRVVPSDGRSRAYLDGSLATATALAETIGPLIEIHGQHGHQTLLAPAARREALDRHGGHDLDTLRALRAHRRDLEAKLDELGGDEIARTREIELLRYQVDEIAQVAVTDAGEDDRLAAREAVLGDAGAHGEAADRAVELLSADGVVGSALAEALAAIRDRVPFEAVSERLYAAQAELVDAVDELRSVAETIEDDPQTLADVQARRERLTGLRRKYGADLAAVIEFHDTAAKRLDELEHHGERAAEVTARLDELAASERAECARLLKARRATAPGLAAAVTGELRRLALPKAQFEIAVDGVDGSDVEFLVSMNPGAPVLPLAKVASGGELSRVMLALQLVVGGDTGTIVYDEIDAGVGGEAATAIGAALAGVGHDHQVLVVTHLAQVAACAAQQLNIVKSAQGEATRTELVPLDDDARIVELARMLSGSPDSDSARTHAAELLAGSEVTPPRPARPRGIG